MKCDVIIPVYKAPEWVKLCVYALFVNTDSDLINKVFLINDCDDEYTINCLNNLKKKYGEKIVLKHNDNNLGFIKTVNRGLELSTAEYILLLNSDCLIAKNCLKKLIDHLTNDEDIGLICPLASNAANITIPIPEGWNYTQIDSLLEKNFSGECFDACTVVGNCLMITRRCFKKVGKLDESYGMGYGEETDYQFKAMEAGFKAKVAVDTYVFHKSEASFGTSKEKQARLEKNRNLFFSRWGKQYYRELKKYQHNDPVKYVLSHLPKNVWYPRIKTLFYIDGIVQNAGGVHVVVDIVNYLTINGESINIIYNLKYPYKENMLFTPILSSKTKGYEVEQLVSTIWKTAFEARIIADAKKAKLLSFVQGYESYFDNGANYGAVELSYKLSDGILTISDYLKDELEKVFGESSEMIPNGINLDLVRVAAHLSNKTPTITLILRNNVMKGDWLLLDILKKLGDLNKPMLINIVSVNKKIILPSVGKIIEIRLLEGPLDRNKIYQLLQHSDIYIDTSLSEGFGLTALESMAAGCVPIVSDSLGINEYIKNHKNGLLVRDVNNSKSYVANIETILKNNHLADNLRANGHETAASYDFDRIVPLYIQYFNNPKLKKHIASLSDSEKAILDNIRGNHEGHAHRIKAFYFAKKIVPKFIKKKVVEVINKLYGYINN